jgi:magnesium transporter
LVESEDKESLLYVGSEEFEQQSKKKLKSKKKRLKNYRKTSGNVTYRERLGGHLHPRDMRRLVTPFSLSNEPELIVRRHVMLLNFDPLRAIILRDRLLVLVPDGADSLLETLENRVRGGAVGVENDAFGEPSDCPSSPRESAESEPLLRTEEADSKDFSPLAGQEDDGEIGTKQFYDDEINEMKGRAWLRLPFELQCLDAALHSVTELLASQALDIQIHSLSSMEHLLRPETGVGDFAQELLRTSKNNVHGMVSRVNGATRALTEVLNEEEDLALCNLSRLISHPERFIQPVPATVLKEESDEPELILVSCNKMALNVRAVNHS